MHTVNPRYRTTKLLHKANNDEFVSTVKHLVNKQQPLSFFRAVVLQTSTRIAASCFSLSSISSMEFRYLARCSINVEGWPRKNRKKKSEYVQEKRHISSLPEDIQQHPEKALTKNSATILDLRAAFGFTGAEMKLHIL